MKVILFNLIQQRNRAISIRKVEDNLSGRKVVVGLSTYQPGDNYPRIDNSPRPRALGPFKTNAPASGMRVIS